jgi:hypothetical protein
MKIKFILGFLPVLVSYVDSLGEVNAGETRGPLIRIRKDHINDVGLLKHELLHAQQWYIATILTLIAAALLQHNGWPYWEHVAWLAPGVSGALYILVKPYRLWAEIQCYKEQAKYYEKDYLPKFAKFISTSYSLDITTEKALERLRS